MAPGSHKHSGRGHQARAGLRPGQSGEGRKQFFFEKKNQKTFVS
jgi:hypothetical protein